MTPQLIRNLKVRSAASLLKDLVKRHQEQANDKPRALVRLSTLTQILEGTPTQIETQEGESWLILTHESPAQTFSVSYLPLKSVELVTLLNPNFFQDLLLNGDPEILDPAQAPTRLELERSLLRLSEQMQTLGSAFNWKADWTVDWRGYDSNPALRAAAASVISALTSVVNDLARDTMAMETLRGIKNFQIFADPAVALKVSHDKAVLKIEFGLQINLKNIVSELKKQMEAKL